MPLFLCGSGILPRVPGTAVAGERPGGLRLDLRADRAVYAVGQSVELTLAVTNAGPAPMALTAPSSQLYDFAILGRGREVWRWSAGQMFLTVLTRLTIPSGESRVFRERWDQQDQAGRPVGPGEYEVVGILIGGERLGLTPQHLRLTVR